MCIDNIHAYTSMYNPKQQKIKTNMKNFMDLSVEKSLNEFAVSHRPQVPYFHWWL